MDDAILQKIAALASKTTNVEVMWLYGSRAKANAGRQSDYDLAIAFNPLKLPSPLDNRLRPELLALDWQRSLMLPERKISIVDIHQTPIPLAFNAISGKLLFCRDIGRKMVEEQRIMSRMELDYQHHLKSYA